MHLEFSQDFSNIEAFSLPRKVVILELSFSNNTSPEESSVCGLSTDNHIHTFAKINQHLKEEN